MKKGLPGLVCEGQGPHTGMWPSCPGVRGCLAFLYPQVDFCRHILLSPAFAECNGLVDASVYVAACTQDLCRCPSCPCATFAEYSRQCAHAGGQPQNWRGADLCRECPTGPTRVTWRPGVWLGRQVQGST